MSIERGKLFETFSLYSRRYFYSCGTKFWLAICQLLDVLPLYGMGQQIRNSTENCIYRVIQRRVWRRRRRNARSQVETTQRTMSGSKIDLIEEQQELYAPSNERNKTQCGSIEHNTEDEEVERKKTEAEGWKIASDAKGKKEKKMAVEIWEMSVMNTRGWRRWWKQFLFHRVNVALVGKHIWNPTGCNRQ